MYGGPISWRTLGRLALPLAAVLVGCAGTVPAGSEATETASDSAMQMPASVAERLLTLLVYRGAEVQRCRGRVLDLSQSKKVFSFSLDEPFQREPLAGTFYVLIFESNRWGDLPAIAAVAMVDTVFADKVVARVEWQRREIDSSDWGMCIW